VQPKSGDLEAPVASGLQVQLSSRKEKGELLKSDIGIKGEEEQKRKIVDGPFSLFGFTAPVGHDLFERDTRTEINRPVRNHRESNQEEGEADWLKRGGCAEKVALAAFSGRCRKRRRVKKSRLGEETSPKTISCS